MTVKHLVLTLLCALPLGPAAAHEFWLAPQSYQVPPGAAIAADFVNGQEFEGNTLSYFDRSTPRFDFGFEGSTLPIRARAGDRPALQMRAPGRDGLLVVVAEKAPARVTYETWEKFAKFVAHKDFRDVEARHDAAGWPRENFRESYTRHIKSLIAVGDGAGSDRAFGLATEFVALTNPYTDDLSQGMAVRLLQDGAPRADAQVEVFDRAPDGSVTITLHRTDDAGEARVPVTAGHEYLFDAVVLRPAPPSDAADAAVWETLWAALTFAVPAE